MKKIRSALATIASGGFILAIAVGLGLGTALLTLLWLNSEDDGPAAVVTTDDGLQIAQDLVVVAREEIPAGTEVTAAMVELGAVARGSAPVEALTDTSDAVGKVARYPMVRGEQVLSSDLVNDTTGVGLAFSVPPGMRAVSVAFSEVMGAGGLVIAGDRVDVLVSTTYEKLFGPGDVISPADSEGHPMVITVLQNMLVLAVGQEFTPPVDDERDPATLRPEDTLAQPGARSVTLAVTPEQTQLLFMSTQQGTLGLALRAFGDESETVLEPEFKLEPTTSAFGSLTLTSP